MSRPRDEGTLFVVFVSPSPAASTQTGSANTFTLYLFPRLLVPAAAGVTEAATYASPRAGRPSTARGRADTPPTRHSGGSSIGPLRTWRTSPNTTRTSRGSTRRPSRPPIASRNKWDSSPTARQTSFSVVALVSAPARSSRRRRRRSPFSVASAVSGAAASMAARRA